MSDTFIFDNWSGLDHIDGMAEGFEQIPAFVTDVADRRRLSGYLVYQAYLSNSRRVFSNVSEERQAEFREFGDAAVMVARKAAAVWGEEPEVVVVGADETVPSTPELPDPPQPPAENANEAAITFLESVYDRATQVWEEDAQAAFDAWEEALAAQGPLRARQAKLQEWAEREGLISTLIETEEENIGALGDGVVAVGWDSEQNRPTVKSYDPDGYMPVLDDVDSQSRFPKKVHLWWIVVLEEGGEDVDYVRRMTWELVPIDPQHPDYEPVEPGPTPAYFGEGDTQTHVCLYTNGLWKLDDIGSLTDPEKGAKDFEQIDVDGNGTLVPADRVSLGKDYIPVVHFPNRLAKRRHYGRSDLAPVAQLLDEIRLTDTDEALASRWAGQPLTVLRDLQSSSEDGTIRLNPGDAYAAGPEGGVDMVDWAENLEYIAKRLDNLLSRLSVNIQLPAGIIGRVDASEVPSGFALALSFTSFDQNIAQTRMARKPKASLVLKFVQREQIQHDPEYYGGDTTVYPAEVRFGTFMPQDKLGEAQLIAALIASKVISQETGIAMAADVGIPVADVQRELALIRVGMGEEASHMADATGSEQVAADFLGVEIKAVEDPDGIDPLGGAVTDPTAGA